MSDPLDRVPLDYASPRYGTPRFPWLDPLLCGLLFAAGVATIAGWPTSFTNADDRIALAGPLAAVVAAAGAFAARRRGSQLSNDLTAMTLYVVAALVATLPTLWPKYDQGRWPLIGLVAVGVGVAIVAFLNVYAIGGLRRRDARGAAAVVLLGMAAATAGLIAATGSLRIAEKAAPLAIALLLTAAVGAFVRNRRALEGVAAFGIAITIAQLASAHLWSELAIWQAACVLVAPLLAVLTASTRFIKRRRPWLRLVLIVGIAALPATIAGGLAGAEALRAQESTGSGEYDGYY